MDEPYDTQAWDEEEEDHTDPYELGIVAPLVGNFLEMYVEMLIDWSYDQ